VQKLQHAHQVLQVKLDTDARLHKHALATAAKERQALEQQVCAAPQAPLAAWPLS
jgi:hypothetical protein